ncbi:MAG: Kdo hydroxylase family protein [Myxococcota bacterium]
MMHEPPPEMTSIHVNPATIDRKELAWQLEGGNILRFAPHALPLPSDEDLHFLRDVLGNHISLKNISYHPEGDYLTGLRASGPIRQRTRDILRQRHQQVQALLQSTLPYACRAGKVNFRPIQEQGRDLNVRASNERIHVDAFASGATHGARVLRLFTNIHPTEARVWKSAGKLSVLLREFAKPWGIPPERNFNPRWRDAAYSACLGLISRLGLHQAALIDSSPYDRCMRRIHNLLKQDEVFQDQRERWSTLSFAPFETWAVMTDMVSHGVISGRHALVNTYYIPLHQCIQPQVAPYYLLQSDRAPQQPLVS